MVVALCHKVAFVGVEPRRVEVQVQVANGVPAFTIAGLPDKAVAESRERVRSALTAIGLALPAKRITINLAPADLPKEGGRFDLPIALGILGASGQVPTGNFPKHEFLGELALDGSVRRVPGVVTAAASARSQNRRLVTDPSPSVRTRRWVSLCRATACLPYTSQRRVWSGPVIRRPHEFLTHTFSGRRVTTARK